jgi:hypothetical protein
MARRGCLKESGDFTGKSDAEILVHLKTPRGKEQLTDALERGRRWVATKRREAAEKAALND